MTITPKLVQDPGGPSSGVETPHSVSEFVSQSTEELLEAAAEEGFGQRKQQFLKMLVHRHMHHANTKH